MWKKYENLPIYHGEKSYCENCGSRFVLGAVIGVKNNGKVFCYIGGCHIGNAFENSNVESYGQPMRFHEIGKLKIVKAPDSLSFERMMNKLCG